MFKVNNKETKRRQWRRSGVSIINFEHIDVVLVFLLLIWNIFHTLFYRFYCYFEQVNVRLVGKPFWNDK